MRFGRVVGTVVATAHTDGLSAMPLLLVQPLDEELKELGAPVIAGDRIGVGPGELVFMEEWREAGLGLAHPYVPIDLGIVGRVDSWYVRGRRHP